MLVFGSHLVVVVFASDEPFVGPLSLDAIFWLGLPLVVIAVWLWFLRVVFRVTKGRGFSLLRVGSMVCSLVWISLMVYCILGYLGDVGAFGRPLADAGHAESASH